MIFFLMFAIRHILYFMIILRIRNKSAYNYQIFQTTDKKLGKWLICIHQNRVGVWNQYPKPCRGLKSIWIAGPAEPGVQGVQLHTHFLAPSVSKGHILSEKNGLIYLYAYPEFSGFRRPWIVNSLISGSL